ncbi:MAG: patatin-like phospholipase family protein [Patescibacteria group bacterium]
MCFGEKKNKKYKVGLALGSGGARGLAHIGVIKVLLENNIPIHCIVGSSIGALIGGIYATTGDVSEVEKIARGNNWRQLLDLMWDPTLKGGLNGGKKIEMFIRKQINGVNFSDLKMRFAAVATNFETGEPVVMKTGDVTLAIKSSLSVPIIFNPVEFNGKILVDGGLSEPVPVDAVRKLGADFVIAVNLDNCHLVKKKKIGFFEAVEDSLSILRHHLSKEKVKAADILVEPKVFPQSLIGWRQFMESDKFIAEGERAMRAALPKLKKLIGM